VSLQREFVLKFGALLLLLLVLIIVVGEGAEDQAGFATLIQVLLKLVLDHDNPPDLVSVLVLRDGQLLGRARDCPERNLCPRDNLLVGADEVVDLGLVHNDNHIGEDLGRLEFFYEKVLSSGDIFTSVDAVGNVEVGIIITLLLLNGAELVAGLS